MLIYDRRCRDIISPLLNVSKLRKRGVTLHLLLEAEREDIPDVVRPIQSSQLINQSDRFMS